MAEARQNPHPDGRRGHGAHPAGHSRRRSSTITKTLDASIESEKEKNDFLPACRHRPGHAGRARSNAAFTRSEVPRQSLHHPPPRGGHRLRRPGRLQQFHRPGLTQNIELNIQVKAAGDVSQLQDWYEQHWQEAEDITPDILTVIERHIREYTPFRRLRQGA